MLALEVFVGKTTPAVDTGAAGAVAVQEVAPLQHEFGDDAVKFAVLVSERSAQMGFGFAGAELSCGVVVPRTLVSVDGGVHGLGKTRRRKRKRRDVYESFPRCAV